MLEALCNCIKAQQCLELNANMHTFALLTCWYLAGIFFSWYIQSWSYVSVLAFKHLVINIEHNVQITFTGWLISYNAMSKSGLDLMMALDDKSGDHS